LKKYSPSSILAQAGHFIDEATGAITPPIHIGCWLYCLDAYHDASFRFWRRYCLSFRVQIP